MLLPINIEDLLNHRKVESNRIEYKKGWNPVSIYHTICAFANDFDNLGGGYILVGIEEENGVAKRPVEGLLTSQLDKIQRDILQYNQLIEPFYAPRISVEEVRKAQTLRCRKYRNRRLGEFLKELELTEGRATGIPTIQKKLKDNGSSLAIIETDENRAYFLIDIPCHPDFVKGSLSNVVSQVELDKNEQLKQNLFQVVSQVVSQVKGADFELILRTFLALQEEMAISRLMNVLKQSNRTRFRKTCLNILIDTNLATPTIPDKPNSSKQRYVLTKSGRQLIEDSKTK
ncbi:MAG: putative DNA binding domain-containing protein [Bacteroidales bacterium]|nr:putative DNA binding domain-containing protein [Bacteroidales bacterium]